MELPSILLIDDKKDVLAGLKRELSKLLSSNEVEIRCWQPTPDEDKEPNELFEEKVDDSTVLVATDYDLTGAGLKGLFGLTIVGWCQQRSIPVGDFSRGHTKDLPEEPNLFELRIPPSDVEGAKFIASSFEGFQAIRKGLIADPGLAEARGASLAGVLARLLGRPKLDDQFALYLTRLGTSNSGLVQRLREFGANSTAPSDDEKLRVLTYVLGHVLVNSILRFPGPLLSLEALCAYVGAAVEESKELDHTFSECRYTGPFSGNAKYYWRDDIDLIIEIAGSSLADQNFQGLGDFNRAAVEVHIGRKLATHSCDREGCDGRKGGYLCPFTHRPVCERADCSVSSSSWIPPGADLSRVERVYYEEWAPLLGL